ncbi:hypothetical protein HNR23_002419 [Nocardiopsis mwathae]|uniref:DOD-type homing endonuclease domain-containing protein n=1 Tax=Nocardiopsis mwathae TaxID=1472723 RepID=A0A7W9YHN7_9ACTN|nr:hypothetical protein [Nocardiopsis mwathae]
MALVCGVSVQSVRNWRTGRRRRSTEEESASYCPQCSGASLDHRAYAYLLGLYLGDGYIGYVGARAKQIWALQISCGNAWPGLINECMEALRAVRPDRPIHIVERAGCKDVKVYWKHWLCLFPQHGTGHKHSRRIILEEWQLTIVEAYPREFIRGLIHSDGCRTTNRVRRKVDGEWKHYEYPRYFFSNASRDILGLFVIVLDRLGVQWKFRWCPGKAGHQIQGIVSIAKKPSVAILDSFIGPKY